MVDGVPAPYRIERKLGTGGMADVYLAKNEGLQRLEALKFLSPRFVADRSLSERFLNEARIAAGLHHPHIAAIYAVSDPSAARPFFSMQYIAGGDLADRLADGRPMPVESACALLSQIAAALDYAHSRGVIHRDVKPANVLLEETGRDARAFVVDFGIARAQEVGTGTRLTRAGMIVGTPEYMSPEQAGAGGEVGPASDQYALAVVAYEMLCGRVPFSVGSYTSEIGVLMAQEGRAAHAHIPSAGTAEVLGQGHPERPSKASRRPLPFMPSVRRGTYCSEG